MLFNAAWGYRTRYYAAAAEKQKSPGDRIRLSHDRRHRSLFHFSAFYIIQYYIFTRVRRRSLFFIVIVRRVVAYFGRPYQVINNRVNKPDIAATTPSVLRKYYELTAGKG